MKNKEKNVLFIVDEYLPIANANGICVSKVNEDLKNKGVMTHILTYNNITTNGDDKSDSSIYRIKLPLIFDKRIEQKYFISLYRKFLKMIHLIFYYPINSKKLQKKIFKKACDIIDELDINTVVLTIKQVEIGSIAKKLKREFPDLKIILYQLDSLRFSPKEKFVSQGYHDNRTYKLEKLIFSHVDQIILLEGMKAQYDHSEYKKYSDKILFAGIPLYIPNLDSSPQKYDKLRPLQFLYTGALTKGIREPDFAIKVLEELSHLCSVNIHFYHRGDYEVYNNKPPFPNFKFNSYIPHNELFEKINQSDILISIGNINTVMTPSKIFEYMSYGKKIIHFQNDDMDTAVPYLERYPLAIIIKQSQYTSTTLEEIMNFINLEYTNIDLAEVHESFKKNMPDYTSGVILSLMDFNNSNQKNPN